MDLTKLVHSKIWSLILGSLAISLLVLIAFRVGLLVGYRKASFSYELNNNYQRIFAPPPPREPWRNPADKNFINSHGISGMIIKRDEQKLTIQDRDQTEKSVLLRANTVIRRHRATLKADELKVDDSVIIIGTPNTQGEVEAKLIRVLPKL